MNFIRQGKVFFEKSLDIGDYSYNFILGQYSEGGFICFPSWERSSKISIDPNGYEDNLDQLLRSGFDITVSEKVTRDIEEWRKKNPDVLEQISKSPGDKIEYDEKKGCGVFFEEEVNIKGRLYEFIFGYHINGGFICLPGEKKSCEASDYFEKFYNKERLIRSGLPEDAASKIADEIDRWSKQNRDQIEDFNRVRNESTSERFKTILLGLKGVKTE